MKTILTAVLAAACSAAAYAADFSDDVIRYAPPPAMQIEADSLPASGPGAQDIASVKSSDSAMTELRKAVKEVQKNELEEMGYYFALKKYPAGTKPTRIYAEIMNVSADEVPGDGYFTLTSGKRATDAFAARVDSDARDEMDNAISGAMTNLSEAARKAMTSENFRKIQLASHARQEDGDFDYLILMAEEADGSIQALTYIRNPY